MIQSIIDTGKALRADFYHARYYIGAAFLIFFVSIVMGYKWEAFHNYLHIQIQSIADIAEELAHAENPMMSMFVFIFINNTVKSIAIIFLGFFLGILPIVFLVVNGMVLGYIYLVMAVMSDSATLSELLIAILPHGIIELPVVIIACGFGLKLGVLVWKRIFYALSNKRGSEGEIKAFLKSTGRLIVFIIVGLLVAAIIETTITPWLMGI